jgi:hypothetical protein
LTNFLNVSVVAMSEIEFEKKQNLYSKMNFLVSRKIHALVKTLVTIQYLRFDRVEYTRNLMEGASASDLHDCCMLEPPSVALVATGSLCANGTAIVLSNVAVLPCLLRKGVRSCLYRTSPVEPCRLLSTFVGVRERRSLV